MAAPRVQEEPSLIQEDQIRNLCTAASKGHATCDDSALIQEPKGTGSASDSIWKFIIEGTWPQSQIGNRFQHSLCDPNVDPNQASPPYLLSRGIKFPLIPHLFFADSFHEEDKELDDPVLQEICLHEMMLEQQMKRRMMMARHMQMAGQTPDFEYLLPKDYVPVAERKFPPKHYVRSPLLWAVITRNIPLVEILLRNPRINVNVRARREQTPLMYASALAYHDVVEKLLTRDDLDINAQDRDGRTAIFYAVYAGLEDIVQLLVSSKKLKLWLVNAKGQTVRDVAREGSLKNILSMLDG